MGQSQLEREVPPVIDDDVAFAGMVEMGDSGRTFVFVVEQVEVDRDAGVQPVERTDYALGIVGIVVRSAIAALLIGVEL